MMTQTGTLPRWLKPANRAVKLLHRAGVRVGTIQVLTVRGRKSGQPRSTPVAPLTVDAKRYVVAGLPRSSWAQNVRASGTGRLSRGRKHDDVEIGRASCWERVWSVEVGGELW